MATFYALFATTPRPPTVAHVCDDIACRLAGAEDVAADLERSLGPAGAPSADGSSTWLRTPCLGLCERAPAALFTIAGRSRGRSSPAPVDAAGVVGRLERRDRPDASNGIGGEQDKSRRPSRPGVPQAGQRRPPAPGRVGVVDPTSLDDYRAIGGLPGARAGPPIGPQQVIDEVAASRLVGRGGAAFPTGRKWAAVAQQPAQPHYLVCNADESEPGTFKDRVLMEARPVRDRRGDDDRRRSRPAPSRATSTSAASTRCAEARLANAIDAARAAAARPDILGSASPSTSRSGAAPAPTSAARRPRSSNRSRASAASRATSRRSRSRSGCSASRPRSTTSRRSSTCPLIVGSDGGARRSRRSAPRARPGPKLFCVSGHVARPGVYEVPFGATLRELLELAGGVPGGRRDPGRSCSAARRASSSGRTRSTRR